MMTLGERMKGYEQNTKHFLLRRTPTIIRVDGKAFHTWTKGCDKPFDSTLHCAMARTAEYLLKEVQNAKIAYTQSDEISILLTDWANFATEQWFSGNVQKMASVSASMATAEFNHWMGDKSFINPALFDARVFQLPKEEVANYFVWRQKDAMRNSVSMLGRSVFSHKELDGKNTTVVKEMLAAEGKSWDDCESWERVGTVLVSGSSGDTYPIFTEDETRTWLEGLLE